MAHLDAMQGTKTDADFFMYDNDVVFRVWLDRRSYETLDSPSLLRAMIAALVKENKRLMDEDDTLRTGG